MTDTTLLSSTSSTDVTGPRDAKEPQLTPLTEGQESIYILSQMANGLPVYNMPFAFRLRGALDLTAVTEALRSLVARHCALRANIIETDKGLRQQVWPNAEPAIEFHDLSHNGSPENVDAQLAKWIDSAARAPFDLARQMPFRTDLFKIAENDHAILFNLHHTFGDLSAIRILFRDFQETYNAILAKRTADLPVVGLQMDEYAMRKAGQPTGEGTLKFWRDRLADFTNDLDLPSDAPRPAMPTFRGGVHYFNLSPTLTAAIKTIARTNKCSPYMAFLALLAVLVYRYTNQRQFALATPFSRRLDPELENTVGYLINLLPIPCAINPRVTFRDLLAEVRKNSLEAFAHEDISLRRILQEAKFTGDSPRNALSRVVFQYFAEGVAALELDGINSERIPLHTGTSKFDLCITMSEEASAVRTEIEYDTDAFNPATIERLGQHFINLAESIVRSPETEIGQLNFLTASEKCFIAEVNETKTSYPRDSSIDQLFEQQVANNPTRIALTFEQTAITYGELNRRADQVAHMLVRRGVRAGDFVGVCLERSPWMVAALIGILKTGAAFVPFDAKYPASRLEYMFQDAGVQFLVTNVAHKDIAPRSIEIVLIEKAPDEQIDPETFKHKPLVSPDSLAYMMYTSGSTGNPKGVTVPHRAVIRLVKNNDFASFSPEEVFLLFAPISFDASTLELWGPLLNGGRLVIYPPNFESLEQFEDVLIREQVTTAWLSSGLFNTVVDKKIEALRMVKQLLVGGDVVSPTHAQRVYSINPQVTLINGYGPTENTTFTCCYTIPRDFSGDRSIPIGRPIRNTQIYILDENLQPLPVGIPGELYCGGDGLSHGYWNKADLTAQAFVAHPFFAGARLYKTGDRVRLLQDGNIEFLGRIDSQIKIRGFRVELGEIESALRGIDGVQDAAACVDSDIANEKRLLAFVIPHPNQALVVNQLHEELRKILPEHACPSRIQIVEKFPLGPNGKVDKKALAGLRSSDPSPSEAAPMNDTEQAIARVWREILQIESVSPDENFFHIGGDSLRAIQTALQINRALGSNLTVMHIFQAPTIRALARKIETAKSQAVPTIRRAREKAPAAKVSAMSDSEVDALLNQLLAQKE